MAPRKWNEWLREKAGMYVSWNYTAHLVTSEGNTACGRVIPTVEKLQHGISFFSEPRVVCKACQRTAVK